MSVIPSLENLLAWFAQVSVLALAGACLPTLFRIRHPKSQLAYYHVLLVTCIAVPLIQPWQHPILVVTGAVAAAAPPTVAWQVVIAGILVFGIAVKLGWLGMGL